MIKTKEFPAPAGQERTLWIESTKKYLCKRHKAAGRDDRGEHRKGENTECCTVENTAAGGPVKRMNHESKLKELNQ